MFAILITRCDPAYSGKSSVLSILIEICNIRDILKLSILFNGIEIRQGIPNPGRFRILMNGSTFSFIILAIGLGAALNIIFPSNLILEK